MQAHTTSRFFLLRHGQSTANAGGPTLHPGSLLLTDLGWEQARRFAAGLTWQPSLLAISPFVRAQQTAEPIRQRFPDMPCETWPVQEYTYLDHTPLLGMTETERAPVNAAFWARCDPAYRDGPNAESFLEFLDRIHNTQRRLLALESGSCVLVATHGLWMQGFRMSALFPEASPKQLMANLRRFNDAFWIDNTTLLEFAIAGDRIHAVDQQHLTSFELKGVDSHA